MTTAGRRRKQETSYSRDGLHLFTIRAYARQGTSSAGTHGGAYINCWINFRHREGALLLAKFYIRDAGWTVHNVTEHRWINGPADVPRSALRYFREAQRDGASLVFHRYEKRASRDGQH